MNTSTQRNCTQQSCISSQNRLSFYEEHYILEPEDFEKDNGYFLYESDENQEVVFLSESYPLAM